MHAWFAVFSTIHSRILLTECASESLYSVQNIAINRIRLIFDSSNTLVYRLGPSIIMGEDVSVNHTVSQDGGTGISRDENYPRNSADFSSLRVDLVNHPDRLR